MMVAIALGIVLAVLLLIYMAAGTGPALIAFSVAIVLCVAAAAIYWALASPYTLLIPAALIAVYFGLAYWGAAHRKPE
jgi:hypothetical protein